MNVPGIVSPFNWTHRMSMTVETLIKDGSLARHIKAIARTHNRRLEAWTATFFVVEFGLQSYNVKKIFLLRVRYGGAL